MNFAKLFDRPKFGQVLVTLDTSSEGKPELRWHCQPPGAHVCSLTVSFSDKQDGWTAARTALEAAGDAQADAAAQMLFETASKLLLPDQHEDLQEAAPARRYKTQPGESAMGIALRQLGNESRWQEIIDLNSERFPEQGPHDYYPIGTDLTMPTGHA